MATISTHGVERVERQLHTTGVRAAHQRHTLTEEAKRVTREIRGVPVDSGALDRSVHGGAGYVLHVDDRGYAIGTSVRYARFVFGGTRAMAARPPQLPPDQGRRAARAIAQDLERVR